MNTHLGKTRWKSGLVLIWRWLSFSHLLRVIGQFPRPPCLPEWCICWPFGPLPSGYQGWLRDPSPGEEWSWLPACAVQIWASEWSQEGLSPAMSCFFGPQQLWVTDPARGQLHTSCCQFLCKRWWPWLESAPVENWISLSSELYLWNSSPEANSPSLGFTVFTSQLFLTHHSEWCKLFLVRSSLGQHLSVSIFIAWSTPGSPWLLLLRLFLEVIRAQGQSHPLGTSKSVRSHHDLFCEGAHTLIVHLPFTFDFFFSS